MRNSVTLHYDTTPPTSDKEIMPNFFIFFKTAKTNKCSEQFMKLLIEHVKIRTSHMYVHFEILNQ